MTSSFDRWMARKTPPRTWAEQDERDRAGACESDNWGDPPDIEHDPFPLIGELPRRGRTKTLIGLPPAPGLQRLERK